jgi:hypothetical protein
VSSATEGVALASFLERFPSDPVWPLFGRAANDDSASLRMRQRAGLTIVGAAHSYANNRDCEIGGAGPRARLATHSRPGPTNGGVAARVPSPDLISTARTTAPPATVPPARPLSLNRCHTVGSCPPGRPDNGSFRACRPVRSSRSATRRRGAGDVATRPSSRAVTDRRRLRPGIRTLPGTVRSTPTRPSPRRCLDHRLVYTIMVIRGMTMMV